MFSDPHFGYIAAVYIIATLTVLILIGWVVVDHGTQRRLLEDLEARGLKRRSDQPKKGTV